MAELSSEVIVARFFTDEHVAAVQKLVRAGCSIVWRVAAPNGLPLDQLEKLKLRLFRAGIAMRTSGMTLAGKWLVMFDAIEQLAFPITVEGEVPVAKVRVSIPLDGSKPSLREMCMLDAHCAQEAGHPGPCLHPLNAEGDFCSGTEECANPPGRQHHAVYCPRYPKGTH